MNQSVGAHSTTSPGVADGRSGLRRRLQGGLLAVGASVLASCGAGSTPGSGPAPVGVRTQTPAAETAAPIFRRDLDATARRWVDSTLASLSLEERVAQLVIPWIPGGYEALDSPGFQETLDWVAELGIGGVSISIGVPHTYVAKLNELQRRAPVPLLVTADFENGGPGMRINHSYALPSLLPQGGGTSFPPTMAFGAVGDPEMAFEYGRITATEARAVGVHMIFAPVLDVNSNPDNPVINTRSFGENPSAVARLGAAFIRGIQSGGAFATAKHFPGHGDTQMDSHIGLPEVSATRDRLDAVELVPFQRAIDGGVDAVMTAHVAMPGVLGAGAPPATLSPELMTGLLRGDMGFDGVLFTDALRMGAITEGYGGDEAAVLSVMAGSDVVLAPESVPGSIDAVVQAVREGRIAESTIDASVRRLLVLKARAGLHQKRLEDVDAVAAVVGSGEHIRVADTVASRSITLVKDSGSRIPVTPSADVRVLSVTYARAIEVPAGRTFDAEMALRTPELTTVRLTDESGSEAYQALRAQLDSTDLVVVHAYVPPRSGQGSVGAPEALRSWVEEAASRRPTLLVSLGNPYLLRDIPTVDAYMVAWGPHEVSQRAAVRALFGEEAITGRLPITIPPQYPVGSGLVRDRERSFTAVAARDPLAEAGIVRGRRPAMDPPTADTTQNRGTAAPSRTDTAATGAEAASPPVREAAPPDTQPSPSQEPVLSAGTLEVGAPGSPAANPTSPLQARQVVARDVPIQISPIEANARRVGMSSDVLAELDSLMVGGILDGAAPGAVLAVGRKGRLVRLRGYGRLDVGSTSTPADEATLWDLASLTKVVATTTAAMVLLERGQLDLDARVVTYLPDWAAGDPRKADVTVRHLLTHQAGLPPFRRFFLDHEGRAAYETAINALPLETAPGAATVYSDIGLMTLGFIVERLSGTSLDRFLAREIWGPLGMQDTGFNPDSVLLPRIAPTEVDNFWRNSGKVHGQVHDENAAAIGGVVGHAGLFSSGRDLAVFADMMLRGGTVPACTPTPGDGTPCSAPRDQPVTVVNASTIRLFSRRADPGSSRALGWDTPSGRSSAGDYFSEFSFGHTGFTGTSIWMDPERDLFVVLLTNRVNPTRENSRHVSLRRQVADLASLAILDVPVERRGGR